MDTRVNCPYCGEVGEVEADVDPSEPGEHVFVQDCEVCCRPWTVRVKVGYEGDVSAEVSR